MSARRLPHPLGTRINRECSVSFTFDGRRYSGYEGDTLASALLANGVQLVARSFKLHRPRGIYSSGIEEPNAVVDLGAGARYTPNASMTAVEIYEGLTARSVNRWPSLRFDGAAINGVFSALLPAGFYYKTFKWPSWHWFEPTIRRLAGMGRAPRESDPDHYDEVSASPDVLVVGGGLAGLAAAASAAEAGASVTLLCSAAVLGGTTGYLPGHLAAELIEKIGLLGVRVLHRTTAFGMYDHNLVCARQRFPIDAAFRGTARQRLWKLRPRAVILATGAFERPVLFPNNDRPGVMSAGAVEKYAHAYGVACGSRLVIVANNDRAYAIGADLRRLGLEVVAIADVRPQPLVQVEKRDWGDTVLLEQCAISGISGRHAVRGCQVDSTSGAPRRFSCDLVLNSGGYTPCVHLHSQAGGKLRWISDSSMFVPDGAPPGIASVGACAGTFSIADVLEHASEVGSAIARQRVAPAAPLSGAGRSLANTFVPRRGKKQFIDIHNDVTADDVVLAARENYRSVEHLKRYTTLGMGTDQGKTSNINALVLMGDETGRTPGVVGTTKFRPPFAPITLGLLAGSRVGGLYRPLKRLPAQSWHVERGAVFEEYGGWWRPSAYPVAGESVDVAAVREASAVRRSAGIFDGTPLGKLEIFGTDAATFLDHMYVGTLSTLAIGEARYGIRLNENGVIADDGVVARLSEHRFWINTTSSGAERTAAAFEEWLQCEFINWKAAVTPVTSRWMNVTIAGPRAWEWLSSIGMPTKLEPARMSHMKMVITEFQGTPLRVLRASFSGELGYEINVPTDKGASLLQCLWRYGPQVDAVPYGVEALQILRIEKGYIHVGTDTDGTTLPGDIGFGRAIERKSANFVGRRSLGTPASRDRERLQLVALTPADGTTRLPVGAQIAPNPPPTQTEGHVTSSTSSPALGRPIALAMLKRGASRVGERVLLHHLGSTIEANVVTAPFLDPLGDRLRG